MNHTLKHRLHALLYRLHPQDRAARALQLALAALIIANVLAVMLETVDGLYRQYRWLFTSFEAVSVTLFFLEYLVRLWVSDLTPDFQRPWGRLRYALTPLALVDLISVLPSVLAMAGLDLRVLRVLRLMRLLKLSRHSHALHRLTGAILSRAGDIAITALFMLVLMLVSSALVYYAEHEAQPNAFSSIPAAWWWAVATLTTIGYGDIYPVTVAGKIIAAVTALIGIGIVALPGGIVASALVESLRTEQPRCCPHCGKELDK